MKKLLLPMAIVCIALGGCVTGAQTMSCRSNLIIEEGKPSTSIGCEDPKFVITCDSTTMSFINGNLRCKSADGNQYSVTDEKFLKDEQCRLQIGERGVWLESGECGCSHPSKLYADQCKTWIQVCRESFGEQSLPAPTKWEDEWQCICANDYEWNADRTACVYKYMGDRSQ